MSGRVQIKADLIAILVRALLLADRPRGGWVKVDDLAKEVGMTRATCYRWLSRLEAAGWPLERDSDNCRHRSNSLGIRSLLIGQRREVDTRAYMRRAA